MVVLTLIEDTSKNIYKDKLFNKLQRMKLREQSRKLIDYMKGSFEAKIRITNSGLILLNQPGINVDQKRIRSTVERIIKGLVYKETGLLTKEIISVFTTDYQKLSQEMTQSLIDVLELLKEGQLITIGDGKVFRYKYSYPKSCPELSGWILCFFETFYVIALATHENYTEKFRLTTAST
jgi:hypothetical protein